MDALYPRLLVTRFAECFGFYRAVLPALTGATLVKGAPEGPYANWDVDEQAVLVLYDRTAMATALGTTGLPARPTAPVQDAAMLVFRVDDVDKALALCLEHGGVLAAPATDRPEWGPTLRSAHLRDPEGHLIELQSY
ncbi:MULTISPECIES: VOC family protein [Kitasatospora]|uniref:Glyoxalase/bleomycin resistance/extradiol dioxygenase family protein n=1 Tax=Kitasatospora cathayae TaxID=3004092 RepID=A0ABY7PXH2_9ACTN|nr:VOC family protein [Kitasatospora sp. HUAS 3-15]WBP85061.1 glyoxalase/bleomycin resistance/extradiol dioxygenase family protein [Kitasatospora sp. HUAS 3-15]